MRMVYREFPKEINSLRWAYSIRNTRWSPPDCPSPSWTLFGENYDEVNRTLVGVLALRWIHLGEYQSFVRSQPAKVRLTRESFNWLRRFYTDVVGKDADALYALITSMVINDLGKDPQLAVDYKTVTGIDIADCNHDAILLRACEAGLVSSLDRLPSQYKNDLVRGIELGATFNFGQLSQAENVPVCLIGLFQMQDRPRSFQLRCMEQLLDIAGAAGHMDWTCAGKLIEPIFRSYRNAFDACQGVITGGLDLRSAYDIVLIRRAEMFHDRGFRLLQVRSSETDRTLARLLCMGNVTTLEMAQLYETTWNCLDDSIRVALVDSLNMDGKKGQPAVQPTYMPAFLSRIKNGRSLEFALRFLYRLMTATDLQDPSAVVIERSVLGILKQYIENGEFDRDPTILENASVPRGVVAQTT